MPGYKGHIIGAVALNTAYVGALAIAPPELLNNTHNVVSDTQLTVGLFVIAVLFGLFPDIDTNSKGQHIYYGLAILADVWLIWGGRFEAAAYLGLAAMTPIVGKHRGWTHSKLAMFLVPSPILIVPLIRNSHLIDTALVVYGAALVGYFSHLLLDGCITKYIHIKGKSW